ncbi:MAG: NYN domain-containing protein [Saccharofermentanales bacterium]
MKIAIMIDGAFYILRAQKIWGNLNPIAAADKLDEYCRAHIERTKRDNPDAELYRIFFYDCPPGDLQSVYPISKKPYRYLKFASSKWRNHFHKELMKKRKVALRMGEMDIRNPKWVLNEDKLKDLVNEKITVKDLVDNDFYIDIRQKGVDMKMGIDIASVSYKKQVEQIILIAGDSDFVPAAKLARREGIDVVLDPLWQTVKSDLFEHIDGKRSMIKNPNMPGNDNRIIREFKFKKDKKFRGKLKRNQKDKD